MRFAAAAFGMAVALGACLLFQVQFLLAKLVLPWFGGAPAVWSTALVIYQALLLAGYAYAHGIATRGSRRRQLATHAALLASVLVLLGLRAFAWPSPITPGEDWKPSPAGSPVWQITALIGTAVGLPFMVLASTSPLVQRWYADLFPDDSPYRLYALSNVGSLLGLVTYPFLVEPYLDVRQQGTAWSVGFAAYTLVMLGIVARMRRVPPVAAPRRAEASAPAAAPALSTQALWLLLSAVPAALLQATTTRLTQDIAAMPFLWMVPLALYLLTFIVAFEIRRVPARTTLSALTTLCLVLALPEWPVAIGIAVTLTMLSLGCLTLHAHLAVRAPAPSALTRYYLLVSSGGVLGSAVVGLGAPLLFTSTIEYPITLIAVLLALATVRAIDGQATPGPAGARHRAIAMALAWVAGMVGAGLVLATFTSGADVVHASRSFFGPVRVRDEVHPSGARVRLLQHGTTLHGQQFLDEARRREPMAYYAHDSGIGRAFAAVHASATPVRVGVVGLGTGTLAVYGRPGDAFTFFEIDRRIVELSTTETPVFRYLRDSHAEVSVVEGDARLALERAPGSAFDILVIDAFCGDAVPAHLVTREAFTLYARHLRRRDSILAVHVSSRYLDLEDIVQAGGAAAGFSAVSVEHEPDAGHAVKTSWMLLSRDPARLSGLGTPRAAGPAEAWTDASSHLLDALRW
ncbi:hypothetical protein TBR22_A23680 [Luteitalea sp. TBR-22]|uniref:fused MFS/spermidine synthase n=1 Tax=Luteitalea sp. TBR-22 TaxID=2802971 RepID=UPI001AFB4675|nr:fused MFS/spermidine synthase [Luteitalea sp. TBR-22]BCS33141.1 hypothetical protein TBR22_A23680 [Luteitalea sp. TBR-22]